MPRVRPQRPLPGLGRLPRPPEPEDLDLVMQETACESRLEARLLSQLREAGLPEPLAQYWFDRVRKWRCDFAWPALKLAIEVEGGVWTQGRHNRALGYMADCRKYNRLAIQGWLLLRYTEREIRLGQAVREIAAVLRARDGNR